MLKDKEEEEEEEKDDDAKNDTQIVLANMDNTIVTSPEDTEESHKQIIYINGRPETDGIG